MADSLECYAAILYKLFRLIKNRHIFVLKTSLSQALMMNILFGVELSKKYNKMNQLISVAKFIGQKYNVDLKHNRFVASLSEKIFGELKDILGLRDDDLLYLLMAAYLHNVGMFINNRSSHKHAEYIIKELSLFRLSEPEIRMIGCIARYHRRSTPKKMHQLYGSLSTEKQILVQKLSAILRITNALDSSHQQKVQDFKVVINSDRSIDLVVQTAVNFVLERMEFEDKKGVFEEVSGNQINLIIKQTEFA
jgi:exopolyphosphatase/guanosine-5'-triphosphate,3'-diphosphate pyrophosphatase